MGKTVTVTRSRTETEYLASEFAKTVEAGTVIAFEGDLGAGKTCFTSGFAKGMGYDGEVNSPTFALVNEYLGGRLDIYHFDMYRVEGWDDLYTTGYFEYLEMGGVLMVEWSENIASALPEDTVKVTIETISENERRITIED
ncbi:MAG: tRNA (adenosine(37)-N6)-threonylcarbamoyltransferase complex ATPase subunit type 1 TsaE [Clostridia bacterium]|nr:tRNA (adenosine(37)-N6)-threonylcarbamoyltransferase complex ATPase subunit type 1 TsaE [Clostridia bacterium]